MRPMSIGHYGPQYRQYCQCSYHTVQTNGLLKALYQTCSSCIGFQQTDIPFVTFATWRVQIFPFRKVYGSRSEIMIGLK